MPRTARVDFPGALHHLITRGIDRQPIVLDGTDRGMFLDRLESLLIKTRTPCFAWALMPNHFHLLLKTSAVPISTLMQKLLTGHAGYFNRRHGRCGHLFQNRFKSILCQEDTYFLELVRYIHLNPLKGELVRSLEELETYPYCGHGAVMGRCSFPWQDTLSVLRLFHGDQNEAQKRYVSFLKEGLKEGKRTDLVEGNLVRCHGEWSDVEPGDRPSSSAGLGCERILGDSDFIDKVLKLRNEVRDRDQRFGAQQYEFRSTLEQVASWFDLAADDLLPPGKGRKTTQARSLFCYLAAREFGVNQIQLARDLGISQSTVSRAVARGRQLAKTDRYSLLSGQKTS